MNILSIGSDRKLFEEGSAVQKRIASYGTLVDELHIVVFAKSSLGVKPTQITPNVWVYPTNSANKLRYISDATKLGKQLLKEKQIDLVTTQDPFEAGHVGLNVVKGSNAHLEVQVHTDFLSPYFAKQSMLNRARVRIADRVIPQADCIRVVSQKLKCGILERFPIVRKKQRIAILPIFSAHKHTAEVPKDIKQQYPQFDVLVLMVGRLESEKNIPLALKSFADAHKKYPKAGLIIAGDGSQKDALIKRAKELGIEKSVVFVGWQQDLTAYYMSADVFLATSNYEGYGMALVEAAEAGLPIVSTNVGVAENLLRAEERPFLCEVGDKTCLSKQLTLLLGDDELRHASGAHITPRLERVIYATWEEYLDALRNAWETCLLEK